MLLVGPIINNDHSFQDKITGEKEPLLFCGKLFFFLFLSKKHIPLNYSVVCLVPPKIKQRYCELDEKDCRKKPIGGVPKNTNKTESQPLKGTHGKEKLTEYNTTTES